MAKTYEPIASQTLASDTATVTLSSIPSTFTDLVAVLHVNPSGNIDMLGQINNTGTSIYSHTRLLGNGSSPASYRSSNQTAYAATINNVSVSTGAYVTSILHFMSYANTNVYKTVLGAGSAAGSGVQRTVSLWRSTSAIDRLDFLAISGTFKAGSTFSLYGLKAA